MSVMGIFRQLRTLSNVRPLPEDRCSKITVGLCRLRHALSIRLGSIPLGTARVARRLAIVGRNCKQQNGNLWRLEEPVLRSVFGAGDLALKGQ
jgi:hypothetical protein